MCATLFRRQCIYSKVFLLDWDILVKVAMQSNSHFSAHTHVLGYSMYSIVYPFSLNLVHTVTTGVQSITAEPGFEDALV